ncbi:PREDICTED: flowering time control protein FPA [Prunus mume]|uniref:Flowering time control protein FPA n=1 Tax=Prunus mume TaxID=102107 RepID=A0ABM0NTV6_PRUMU|nr:PREDICTED: flowering time control protein FPA [Prunus mume]
MTGRGGGGRDRFRMEHPENRGGGGGPRRFDSKNGKAPPSRHLWVGNLSHSIMENDLTEHFLQFGELESVAFQPGRSYAFLNFKREDEAIAAMESLQGFPVAGNPLRIEFTKADKSSAPSRDEDYSQRRDEQRSALRGSPFLQRESRARQASPEQFYQEKSNMNDKNAEPSAVLWIGFPALLKVDELILKKAFSPFGEIEKITAFPGRSYAFVRFRSVMSACRAKDALQGKLFGNPRVHICFAKSETGSSNSGRNLMNVPPSPHFKGNDRSGSPENFREESKFGSLTGNPSIRSPQYFPDLDAGDSDPYSLNKKGNLWTGENNTFDQRFGEMGSELGLSEDTYDHRGSPKREKYAHLHNYSQRFPQTSQPYEEPWDLPEDIHFHHGAKKLKTESFLPDRELPEYALSDFEQERHGFPRSYSDFPQSDSSKRNFEAGPFGCKQIPERPMNFALPPGQRGDRWKESYDNFQVNSGSQLANPVDRRRFTPEPDQSSFNVWKWEGTIAKGGTPVCRARCFPVGKVLDMILPEFLDCTARTGLDMLSKHYYQAASAWVVFFVPESDADIGYYNEFMHYLGEKQRAAVAKLDDKNTLFLVPPSDFSEKVLKVPGKLSISGVVLRLEHPSSNFGSHHQQHERKDRRLLSFPGDASYTNPSTPSESIHPFTSLPDSSKPGGSNLSFLGNLITSAPPASYSGSAHGVGNGSESYNENRHDYPLHKGSPTLGPNWSSHHLQNSVSGSRNRPTQMSSIAVDPIHQDHRIMQRAVQESSTAGGISHIRNSSSSLHETQSSPSLAALQPDQLAQLASSLLGQQRQPGSTPNPYTREDFRQRNTMNESDNLPRTSQRFGLQNNQVSSESSTSQFGQVQELQQLQQQVSTVSAMPHMGQRELQAVVQGNQQLQSISSNEAVETDPQKQRMQATLQLAAALLQQIQGGKGS